MLSHATLLPTLARVLRDDGKRSVDLCVGIQSVWLVLSNFSQFHQLLIENQVGVLTMEVLDLEIKRTEHRVKVRQQCTTGSLSCLPYSVASKPNPMWIHGHVASQNTKPYVDSCHMLSLHPLHVKLSSWVLWVCPKHFELRPSGSQDLQFCPRTCNQHQHPCLASDQLTTARDASCYSSCDRKREQFSSSSYSGSCAANRQKLHGRMQPAAELIAACIQRHR